ncbi:uncharacterized protein LOC132730816 [Ruditapes philippinarum]|uniref:uncharacterized protein LOC132730816 n=1 Tax=Ruditapes philippinarum TaxID=129788 RepID=UPI00295A85F0|nr:uncharacterized protein LOC132730816 [Ruditapes philippinarum]
MADRRTIFQCEPCNRLFDDMTVFARHSCAQTDSGGYDAPTLFGEQEAIDSPTDNSCSTSSSSEALLYWTRPATLLLIEQYKKITEGSKMKKKKKCGKKFLCTLSNITTLSLPHNVKEDEKP